MTIKELHKICEKLIKEGKGNYSATCEGGCVGLCNPYEYPEMGFSKSEKEIIF